MSATEVQRPLLASDTCYSSYSIQSNNENEPSSSTSTCELDKKETNYFQTHDKICLTILGLILITGLSIGIYLLGNEGHERKTVKIHLTTRDLWRAQAPTSVMPKLKLPVENLLFLQTNSSKCDSQSQCSKHIQELQIKHMQQLEEPDILYNFLISREGDIFEGRGWNFQTTFLNYSTKNSITIAFLEKYHENVPSEKQADSARLFVHSAIEEGKLERCFDISAWDGNKFFVRLAEQIQDFLSSCKRRT